MKSVSLVLFSVGRNSLLGLKGIFVPLKVPAIIFVVACLFVRSVFVSSSSYYYSSSSSYSSYYASCLLSLSLIVLVRILPTLLTPIIIRMISRRIRFC